MKKTNVKTLAQAIINKEKYFNYFNPEKLNFTKLFPKQTLYKDKDFNSYETYVNVDETIFSMLNETDVTNSFFTGILYKINNPDMVWRMMESDNEYIYHNSDYEDGKGSLSMKDVNSVQEVKKMKQLLDRVVLRENPVFLNELLTKSQFEILMSEHIALLVKGRKAHNSDCNTQLFFKDMMPICEMMNDIAIKCKHSDRRWNLSKDEALTSKTHLHFDRVEQEYLKNVELDQHTPNTVYEITFNKLIDWYSTSSVRSFIQHNSYNTEDANHEYITKLAQHMVYFAITWCQAHEEKYIREDKLHEQIDFMSLIGKRL